MMALEKSTQFLLKKCSFLAYRKNSNFKEIDKLEDQTIA